MRTQQRPFVVEVKSRRRSIVKAKSIWGDTNLQALAKEVEEDVQELFEPAKQLPGAADLDLLGKDQAFAIADNSVVADQEFEAAPFQETDQLEADRQIALASEIKRHKRRLATAKKRSESGRPRPRAHLISVDPIEIGLLSTEIAARKGDLIKLIDENDQLKGMLRARLNKENDWLREMIARYTS